MGKSIVSIVKYERGIESVRKAVELCHGLDDLPKGGTVFIKPNIVIWTRAVNFPKWGVITTSRVVEAVVVLLKEKGIDNIIIGEGTVTNDPRDRDTAAHAFESLGYSVLKKRYGVQAINVFERQFESVNLGSGVELNFNSDILHSNFVVNLPVLKTHAQTVVSLGMKNLKGTIDIRSRKRCHNENAEKDLNYHISLLSEKLPPMLTVVDGIFTLERGPGLDGKARRSNILLASTDVLSADIVGTIILGHQPSSVPYLSHAAARRSRPLDASDIEVLGQEIGKVAAFHEYTFQYNQKNDLPLQLQKIGIEGLSYPKFDHSMCTYCGEANSLILSAIANAWEGKRWDNVQILTGKQMKPTPGMNKTILVGKCMYLANRNNPDIKEMIAIRGCPPAPKDIFNALKKADINVDPKYFEETNLAAGRYMKRYEGKKEFDEAFFRID